MLKQGHAETSGGFNDAVIDFVEEKQQKDENFFTRKICVI